jgi:anti-sigma B factor antagonist
MTQHFRLETIDGITVATWIGTKVVPEATVPLYALAGDGRLLLDLGNVRFLSSNALGILVSFQKKVDAAGGRLRLCCLDPDLLELLRITKVDRIFEVFDSRQEAIRDF